MVCNAHHGYLRLRGKTNLILCQFYDIMVHITWALLRRIGGLVMSLKQAMAADRRYVAERYEEPQGYQNLREAATDIVRMKIAPLFTSLHYRSAFRTADQLKMSVNFANDKMYTISPSPIWNKEPEKMTKYMGKMPFVQVYYSSYFSSCNKTELWEEVIKAAAGEEWQIDGRINLEKKKVTLILDMS